MWDVRAICDLCGAVSGSFPSRSNAMRVLRRLGWVKGDKVGVMRCPDCAREFGDRTVSANGNIFASGYDTVSAKVDVQRVVDSVENVKDMDDVFDGDFGDGYLDVK